MSFGKDIYVPLANIDMVEFKGSNSLIKDGAIPITDISDIDEYIKYKKKDGYRTVPLNREVC